MLAVEALAGLASPLLRRALHLVFVAGLTGLIAIQLVKRAGDHSSALVIALAAAVGIAVALLYLRVPPGEELPDDFSPSPIVFLALFLLTSPIEKLVMPEDVNAAVTDVSARTPVVMIVFDEFPEFSLMNRSKKIDADRFPNFARLARNATWFRNATTVSHSTTKAVPAIMTGIRPQPNKLPIFADHPDNIFTLLGGSYRMNVVESQTSLCPKQLCGDDRPRLTSSGAKPKEASLYSDASYVYLHLIAPPRLEERLPSVSTAWENFGNEGGTQASISLSGDDGRAPTGHPEVWDVHVPPAGGRSRPASAVIDAKPLALLRSLPEAFRFYPSQVTGRAQRSGRRPTGGDRRKWGALRAPRRRSTPPAWSGSRSSCRKSYSTSAGTPCVSLPLAGPVPASHSRSSLRLSCYLEGGRHAAESLVARERCEDGPQLGPALRARQNPAERSQVAADGFQLPEDRLRRAGSSSSGAPPRSSRKRSSVGRSSSVAADGSGARLRHLAVRRASASVREPRSAGTSDNGASAAAASSSSGIAAIASTASRATARDPAGRRTVGSASSRR